MDNEVLNFSYTGAYQEIEILPGKYKFEVWGASGGNAKDNASKKGGAGGYSQREKIITEKTKAYIFVGGTSTDPKIPGFNGGGIGGDNRTGAGGGATDIRIGGSELSNRVIVAGGGGGAYSGNTRPGNGGAGGGLEGIKGTIGNAGTQTTGHSLGVGQDSPGTANCGAGGGYYGGLSNNYVDSNYGSAGGGSGYIGGVVNGTTIDGSKSIPNFNGGTTTGNVGNGYCRITILELHSSIKAHCKIDGAIREVDKMSVKVDGNWKEVDSVYIKVDGNWKKSE